MWTDLKNLKPKEEEKWKRYKYFHFIYKRLNIYKNSIIYVIGPDICNNILNHIEGIINSKHGEEGMLK